MRGSSGRRAARDLCRYAGVRPPAYRRSSRAISQVRHRPTLDACATPPFPLVELAETAIAQRWMRAEPGHFRWSSLPRPPSPNAGCVRNPAVTRVAGWRSRFAERRGSIRLRVDAPLKRSRRRDHAVAAPAGRGQFSRHERAAFRANLFEPASRVAAGRFIGFVVGGHRFSMTLGRKKPEAPRWRRRGLRAVGGERQLGLGAPGRA